MKGSLLLDVDPEFGSSFSTSPDSPDAAFKPLPTFHTLDSPENALRLELFGPEVDPSVQGEETSTRHIDVGLIAS